MLDLDYSRRHIIFNGESDSEHDLVMGGNTPLITPVPKRSSLEVAYANGTIDTSEINGVLYFQDLEIQYNMFCIIPVYSSGTARNSDTLNALCNEKIVEVEEWLYSGPATLYDYGLPSALVNADCKSITSVKSCANDVWIIRFTISFKADFNLSTYGPSAEPTWERNGRFIVYNGYASYELGLIMSGTTPVTTVEPKVKELSWPKKDGSLNLSHGRGGYSRGYNSQFYQNRSITYKFIKFFSKKDQYGYERNACEMNQLVQEDLYRLCMWFYVHGNQPFTTIDGVITYGGTRTMLMDSTWINPNSYPYGNIPCKFLASAMVQSVKASKILYPDRWALVLDVEFSTYPEFFNGTVYLPPPSDPSPATNIVFTSWKHYAEFGVDERDPMTYMIPFNGEQNIEDGIYMPCDILEIANSLTYSENSIPDDGEYCISNGTILCKFPFSVPSYEHPSKHITTGNKNFELLIKVPRYIKLTCADRSVYFKIDLDNSHATNIDVISDISVTYVDDQEQTIAQTTQGIIGLAEDFDGSVYAVLTPVSGVIFTPTEVDGFEFSIPCTASYVQMITGEDILSQYGLWGENEAAVCNIATAATAITEQIGTTEDTVYSGTQIKPYNSTETGLYPFKFSVPSSGDILFLVTPLVEDTPNTYILCDSAKPEGGDIQWQQ